MPQIKQEEATPRYKAELRTELGAGYFNRGQYDVALEELGEAIKFDPTYPQIYNILGLVYAELGDEKKAEENFRRGLELAPSDSEIHHNWGGTWLHARQARESIAEFESRAAQPALPRARVRAGQCGQVRRSGRPAAAAVFPAGARAHQATRSPRTTLRCCLPGRPSRDARALMRFVMAQNPPSPEGLFLGMCIERRLQDRQSEESYIMQLKNRYPNSADARAIAAGACE
jgi:type IV pilus assembly protein PilF